MSDSVITRSARDGQVADGLHIRLFQADALRLPAGRWRTQDVRSPFWRLYRNRSEGAFLTMPDGNCYELSAHRVHFIPAGVSFSCGNRADFDHFYVHFDVVGLSFLTMRVLFDRPLTLAPNDDCEACAEGVARRIEANRQPLDLAGRCHTKALVYEGLAQYLDALPPEQWERGIRAAEQGEPVASALQFLEENVGAPLRIADLANLCCLSPDYFARRFRDSLGQAPGAFILHRRLTLASQRLLFTSDSLEQIASDCGFGNRFYFSRMFAREIGTSPAAYRKRTRV